MKSYISSIISEQVSRTRVLKKLIPYPIKYSELTGLTERCTNLLDDLAIRLDGLQNELASREENDVRDIFREIRICVREVSLVEYYGIPALYFQTEEIGLMNNIMFRIHQELKLPFPSPSICCVSNDYYFSMPYTNTIFVPLAESDFLLHMVDIYHELGHQLHVKIDSDIRLDNLGAAYGQAVTRINDFYSELLAAKRKETGPEEILMMIGSIHKNWELWIKEFFCDLFAIYSVGPAYAWSHMHLTTKISKNIHELSLFVKQVHPSDDARMKILLEALAITGFSKEASEIKQRWDKMTDFWGPHSAVYQYAFPLSLLRELATIFLDGFKKSGFEVISPAALAGGGNQIRFLFDQAWKKFWAGEYESFRKWEREQIARLRENITQKAIKIDTGLSSQHL